VVWPPFRSRTAKEQNTHTRARSLSADDDDDDVEFFGAVSFNRVPAVMRRAHRTLRAPVPPPGRSTEAADWRDGPWMPT